MKANKLIVIMIVLAFLVATLSVSSASTQPLLAFEPWTTELVDTTTSNTGQYVSIAHDPITGRAFISYYDATNQDLRMAYQVPAGSGNCGSNSAWQCVTVDEDGDVGKYSSIDVVYVQNMFPTPSYTQIGISYYDETNDALKYASGYYFIILDWTIYEVEDTGGNFTYGQYSSIKFSSDLKPHIAYHYSVTVTPSFGGVKYASFLGDGSGNCGDGNNWYCIPIDGKSNQPGYGTHVSLDMDYEDNPRIAYYNSVDGDLYYAYFILFTNDTCMNPGWYCMMVDGNGDVGKFVSIHARDNPSDKLQFAYYDASENEIRYAVPNTEGGYDSFVIDGVGNFTGDLGLSLTIDEQGYPIIAYMSATSYGTGTDLLIARPAAVYGMDDGNCGDIPPGSFLPFQYWQCMTIDYGGELTKKGSYAAVSVNPSGLAMVAYYESDFTGRLRVAQQYYTSYMPLIFK